MIDSHKWLLAAFLLTPSVCLATQGAAGFEQTVQPFLAKNCALCHNEKAKTAGLNVGAYTSPGAVEEHRDVWENILKKLKAGEMPPKGMPRPDPEQLRAVTGWIEAEFDRADKLAPVEAGRVTARRLNRAEYNNTVRDLLGVDTHPADAFPQDDSGYGFDDIGDVLSLPPVLMEKYLTAAEKISRVALLGPDPMKPTVVKLSDPQRHIPTLTKPPAVYDEQGLSMPNALHAMHRFPVDGEYTLRVAAKGFRPAGSEEVQLAVWIDGKLEKTLELNAGDNAMKSDNPGQQTLSAHPLEFRVAMTAGDHWLAVSIPHYYEGLPKSFGGPNPSAKPEPPPVDFNSMFPPKPDATPERLAMRAEFIAKRIKEMKQINSAAADFIEVLGPYRERMGPSAESVKKIYVCGHLDGHHDASCPRKIVANLEERAFRRPVAEREVTPYLKLVSAAQARGDSLERGLSVAVEAILVSPDFLFRIERGPKEGTHPVNPFELASRLSYFLWSTMPDEELYRCAKDGTLSRPDVIEAQTRRMLKDPKSSALATNFGGQWLEFRALESASPDRERFPDFDEYLRMSMRRETELFIASVIGEDRSVLDFLDGKYTFLNERLAEYYGIGGVKGPEFQRVDLSANPERGGVLTQSSVLTVSSYATRTSPVLRGKWVLENILNDPPPPPPPDVPNLNVEEVGTSVSMRQQMEKHRSNAVCASCHQRMDPLGFGLENYNAIGQWRAKDGKFPVDAAGTLPDGRSFTTPEGMKQILKDDPQTFARCIAEKLLTYALGRGVERYDRPAMNAIVARMAADQYRFSSLVLGIVDSAAFQERDEGKVEVKAGAKHDDHHS